jgi:ATP-dependent Clp protease protease subunit
MEVISMSERLFDKSYIELVQGVPQFEEYLFWSYLKERKIIFNTDVDENLIERASLQILKWNDEDKDVPISERKVIEIYIYSGGGDVIAGLGLIDVIKTSKTPVHTISLGLCASMGALILIAGHHRKAYKNSTVLIHDGSLMLMNTAKKAKQTMAFYDSLDGRLRDLVVSNTKISPELYDEKSDEEWYMFGDEAHVLGIVDELII